MLLLLLSRAPLLPRSGLLQLRGAAHASQPGQAAELLLGFSSPRTCVSFVLEHASPPCQIFLPGYSICFPLEFPELQVALHSYPFLLLYSIFWIWVTGHRCTLLFTLRQFIQVTGIMLHYAVRPVVRSVFSDACSAFVLFCWVRVCIHCPESSSQAGAFWYLSRLWHLSRC